MDRNAVNAAATTAELVGLRRVGHLAQASLGAGLRDAARGRHRGA